MMNSDKRLSIAAREKAEQYPEEKNCDEIIKIYNEVVAKSNEDTILSSRP